MIRVLVVDDSPTVRLLLKSVLDSEPDINVVDTARNGNEAIQKTISLNPDLITMDIHMDGMDGFEATRLIMEKCPRPIVIVTSSFNPGEVRLSFQALKAGALALVEKPYGPSSPNFNENVEKLTHTIRLMVDVKVVSRRQSYGQRKPSPLALSSEGHYEVLAIGASTGGPAALSILLNKLPVNFHSPILVVQHISEGFDNGLAKWLSISTNRNVVLAEDGQMLTNDLVLIAPQGKNMGVSKTKRIFLDGKKDSQSSAFCPSATFLFNSVTDVFGSEVVGVILTGMGNDGVDGLTAIHKAGGFVIAQDETSSVVYGMPRAAVEAGIVDKVLPLENISDALSILFKNT